MDIRIDEGLRAYIDPLTDDEREALERSLLAEGCRDALVLWGDLLIDGHNRYALCMKHGIPFETRQNTSFKSMDDVHLWMIENHLGRRSVSDFQRGVLALRKKEILQSRSVPPWEDDGSTPPPEPPPIPPAAALSRQALAREARISSNTLGADREDPESRCAGTGAGGEGRRDLHQRRGGGRDLAARAAGRGGGGRQKGIAAGGTRSAPGQGAAAERGGAGYPDREYRGFAGGGGAATGVAGAADG